jgi:hypothetical protein
VLGYRAAIPGGRLAPLISTVVRRLPQTEQRNRSPFHGTSPRPSSIRARRSASRSWPHLSHETASRRPLGCKDGPGRRERPEVRPHHGYRSAICSTEPHVLALSIGIAPPQAAFAGATRFVVPRPPHSSQGAPVDRRTPSQQDLAARGDPAGRTPLAPAANSSSKPASIMLRRRPSRSVPSGQNDHRGR